MNEKESLKELTLYFVKAKAWIHGIGATQYWGGEYFLAGNEAEAELKAEAWLHENWWNEDGIENILFETSEIRKSIFY